MTCGTWSRSWESLISTKTLTMFVGFGNALSNYRHSVNTWNLETKDNWKQDKPSILMPILYFNCSWDPSVINYFYLKDGQVHGIQGGQVVYSSTPWIKRVCSLNLAANFFYHQLWIMVNNLMFCFLPFSYIFCLLQVSLSRTTFVTR